MGKRLRWTLSVSEVIVSLHKYDLGVGGDIKSAFNPMAFMVTYLSRNHNSCFANITDSYNSLTSEIWGRPVDEGETYEGGTILWGMHSLTTVDKTIVMQHGCILLLVRPVWNEHMQALFHNFYRWIQGRIQEFLKGGWFFAIAVWQSFLYKAIVTTKFKDFTTTKWATSI